MLKKDGVIIFGTSSEKETEKAGRSFAKHVKGGDVLLFYGSVGSGKTVFARGLCRGLGFKGYVNSPSYIIMNMYGTEDVTVCHYDLYRIGSTAELEETGFYEFCSRPDTVTIVEWSEMLDGELPEKRIEIRIETVGQDERKFEIKRVG